MKDFTPGRADDAIPYVDLIGRFLAGTIGAAEFEVEYLRLAKDEQKLLPEKVREITDDLFYDVDEYVEDPELRASAGGLDDDELRVKAEASYRKLVDAIDFLRSQEISG